MLEKIIPEGIQQIFIGSQNQCIIVLCIKSFVHRITSMHLIISKYVVTGYENIDIEKDSPISVHSIRNYFDFDSSFKFLKK